MTTDIRVALAGVGNCASSLVQGIEYYRKQPKPAGLSAAKIGNYTVTQIRFVAAFDVDERKVGKDLSEAIFSEPNNARKIMEPSSFGFDVEMAQPLDGVSPVTGEKIQLSNTKPASITRVLEDSKADILVNLTPTGASRATEMYAQASLRAGCAFINATPSKIASEVKWQSRYKKKKVPLAGDDVMDQIGSTVLHRNLLAFMVERGLHLSETYQLDIGGGTESQMALDKKRYEIKRNVKTAAVAAAVPYPFPITAGSSDFVDFMENKRTSYFWIRGEYFAGTEFSIDMRLSLEDGPACAGTLTDIIRMVKIALDRQMGGPLTAASAYGFKAPPKKIPLSRIRPEVEEFITVAKA